MLDLQVRAGRPVSTLFATAESSRARVLLDLLAQAPHDLPSQTVSARPATLAEIQEALPQGTVLVAYAVTGDLLIVWMVSTERAEVVYRTIDSESLESAAGRFVRLLQSGRNRFEALRLAAELYNVLVLPIEPWLVAESSLVIVPDKFLAQVPFAALRSRQRGRFLVEDHPLAFAPSATLYLRSLRRDCELTSGTARPLVVGNPAFDRTGISPSLVDLPQAEAEALRVAEILGDADLVTGPEATKRSFLAMAPQASSVHLAVHGIADYQQPLLSRFLLARDPDSGDPGVLYAYELYRLQFHATRLVFLSSCAAAAGPALGREGNLSLVRPFLATGVPAVVGSLWPVPDKTPGDLVVRFYSGLESGVDPARALRAAQIEQIRAKPGTAAGWNWAAFQLHGGACP
jgi:CHAT domain-containing protein